MFSHYQREDYQCSECLSKRYIILLGMDNKCAYVYCGSCEHFIQTEDINKFANESETFLAGIYKDEKIYDCKDMEYLVFYVAMMREVPRQYVNAKIRLKQIQNK